MKAFACTCEDVTLADLDEAAALGMGDIESAKRYTAYGTGPCQGKSCMVSVARHLEARAHLPPEAMVPVTPRPPAAPLPFALLAGLDPDRLPLTPHPEAPRAEPHPLRPEGPVPARADVVIVGGGIMGLALAYELGLRGVSDVVVLERGYLCEGASGRNGGGVRMQWSSPTHVRLARRSIEKMRSFAQELGVNIWLRQGGYLFVARDGEAVPLLERNAKLHRALGVETEVIGPSDARGLVPELEIGGVVAASYNRKDGVIFPWPFLWGYADGARRLGARVETFTRTTGIEVGAGRVAAVQTDRGRIATREVVVAAGAWSPQVARMAGVELPNEPHRHEILVTEALKPFLDPLVTVVESGLYFSQSLRGEIVGGLGDPATRPGLDQSSSLRFLARFARAALEIMPRLGAVKVVRQWAGCYDVTPDRSPILGETPGVRGLFQMSGFVGHGFMMAPAVAELYADFLAGRGKDEIFDRFSLGRFAEGRLEPEDFIIG